MGHLERGEKNVSFNSIAKVANALSVPLSDLFMGLEDDSDSKTQIPHSRGLSRPHGALDRERLLSKVAAVERELRGIREIALSGKDRRSRNRRAKTSK